MEHGAVICAMLFCCMEKNEAIAFFVTVQKTEKHLEILVIHLQKRTFKLSEYGKTNESPQFFMAKTLNAKRKQAIPGIIKVS